MVPHCQRSVIVAGFSVVHLSVVKFDCARNEAMHDKCYAADMCKCLCSSKSKETACGTLRVNGLYSTTDTEVSTEKAAATTACRQADIALLTASSQ